MNTIELNQFGLAELDSAEMREIDGGGEPWYQWLDSNYDRLKAEFLKGWNSCGCSR